MVGEAYTSGWKSTKLHRHFFGVSFNSPFAWGISAVYSVLYNPCHVSVPLPNVKGFDVPAVKPAEKNETRRNRTTPGENVAEERVLVVPTELFHALGHFQGFSSDVERYLPGLLESDQVTYRRRSEMEEDPSFKQLIPYMLFRYQRPDGSVELFQYTRGSGQGEARLHAKRSVGIGGHISTVDAGTGGNAGPGDARVGGTPQSEGASDTSSLHREDSVYREGLERELAEEVVLETGFTEKCVGLINDDQTPVGKVHLGVVHLLDVQEPKVRPNESEILDAGFLAVDQIMAELQQFETWSQIVVRALFG